VTSEGGWQRLHPMSAIVRAGRGAIAILVLLVPTLLGRGQLTDTVIRLGIVALIAVFGFVHWLVTRWRIEGDDLQIETGLIRRQSLRFPLSQVQAVDVIRPGLARLFGVAELRLRMAGSTAGTARLAYLGEDEVEPLRRRLLALARGEDGEPKPDEPAAPERVLTTVPTGRLIASILVSDVGLLAETVLFGIVLAAILAPSAAAGVLSGGAAEVIAVATVVWRRFNQEYKLSVAAVPDGLRLHSGLVALNTETIRPGRVQGVRMVEPLLWRRLGWCRLEVDLAGRQRRKGEGEAQRGQLRAVLPVGSRAVAYELLDHIVPGAPRTGSRPPRRVLAKSPLRWRFLAWSATESVVLSVTGRIRRVSVWVPLEKAQSVRRVEGPVQRRLQLASVHVDTAGKALHATLRDRDRAEADAALADLVERARAARRRGPP
jgi:putative membrane protein